MPILEIVLSSAFVIALDRALLRLLVGHALPGASPVRTARASVSSITYGFIAAAP